MGGQGVKVICHRVGHGLSHPLIAAGMSPIPLLQVSWFGPRASFWAANRTKWLTLF